MTTEVGEAAKTEIRSISFDDEEAIPAIEQLQQTYPDADIFLNGELTVDFPEGVKIPVEPNQMVTAQLVRSSIKFSYCDFGMAVSFPGSRSEIAFLREQYAIKTVEVRIVQKNSIN